MYTEYRVYIAHNQSGEATNENRELEKRNKSNSKESVELNSLSDSLLARVFMYISLRFALFFALGLNFYSGISSSDNALCTGISASQSSLLIVPVIDVIVCPFRNHCKTPQMYKRLSIHRGN